MSFGGVPFMTLFLPRDDHILMEQPIFPRELDAVRRSAHLEDKGARPIKRLIKTGVGYVVLGGKERELQA
jgi:hypothetical protein